MAKNRDELRLENDNFYDSRGDSEGGINNLINAVEQKEITGRGIDNFVFKKDVKGLITSGAIADPLNIALDYTTKDHYTADLTGRAETLLKLNPQNLLDGQESHLRILKNSGQEIQFLNVSKVTGKPIEKAETDIVMKFYKIDTVVVAETFATQALAHYKEKPDLNKPTTIPATTGEVNIGVNDAVTIKSNGDVYLNDGDLVADNHNVRAIGSGYIKSDSYVEAGSFVKAGSYLESGSARVILKPTIGGTQQQEILGTGFNGLKNLYWANTEGKLELHPYFLGGNTLASLNNFGELERNTIGNTVDIYADAIRSVDLVGSGDRSVIASSSGLLLAGGKTDLSEFSSSVTGGIVDLYVKGVIVNGVVHLRVKYEGLGNESLTTGALIPAGYRPEGYMQVFVGYNFVRVLPNGTLTVSGDGTWSNTDWLTLSYKAFS